MAIMTPTALLSTTLLLAATTAWAQAGAFVPTTLDPSTTYTLQVKSPNPALDGAQLTLREGPTDTFSELQPLGVWLSDRVARQPWSFHAETSPVDGRFYRLYGNGGITHLRALGSEVAMQLYAAPTGLNYESELGEGQDTSADFWRFSESRAEGGTGPEMYNANPKYSANSGGEPWGGAGSWRSCQEDLGINEWTFVWFDGLNNPAEWCPNIGSGISFYAVPSTTTTGNNNTTTGTATTSGFATATTSSAGQTLTGVPTSGGASSSRGLGGVAAGMAAALVMGAAGLM